MINPASSESSCDSLSSIGSQRFSVSLLLDEENFVACDCPIDEDSIRRCCGKVLDTQILLSLESVGEIELSVQFVGQSDMQALNKQYRGKNSPTNVLSFESSFPAIPLSESADDGNLLALGDLVFCPDVVKEEARAQGKTEEQHWMHLFVHGTLHLCGYDHEDANEAETMESLEIQILSHLGIPDPYDIIEKQ